MENGTSITTFEISRTNPQPSIPKVQGKDERHRRRSTASVQVPILHMGPLEREDPSTPDAVMQRAHGVGLMELCHTKSRKVLNKEIGTVLTDRIRVCRGRRRGSTVSFTRCYEHSVLFTFSYHLN